MPLADLFVDKGKDSGFPPWFSVLGLVLTDGARAACYQ